MNWRKIRIIAWKDMLEVRQNKSVVLSIVMVPLIILVILPLVMLLVSGSPATADAFTSDPDLQLLFENIPPAMRTVFAGMNEVQMSMALMLGYLFAPMFLIMPLMSAPSISAESFAGERERKTLEALLYTSASDAELFIGKSLAAFVPSVLIAWLSFVLYVLVLNIGGWSIFGAIWFPLPLWYPLVFWVTPAFSALGIAATVLISTRVQTFMGAYQSSSALVIVVLGLVVGQAVGLIYLSVGIGILLGFVIWLAAGMLFFLGVQQFNRKKLLVQNAV